MLDCGWIEAVVNGSLVGGGGSSAQASEDAAVVLGVFTGREMQEWLPPPHQRCMHTLHQPAPLVQHLQGSFA